MEDGFKMTEWNKPATGGLRKLGKFVIQNDPLKDLLFRLSINNPAIFENFMNISDDKIKLISDHVGKPFEEVNDALTEMAADLDEVIYDVQLILLADTLWLPPYEGPLEGLKFTPTKEEETIIRLLTSNYVFVSSLPQEITISKVCEYTGMSYTEVERIMTEMEYKDGNNILQ